MLQLLTILAAKKSSDGSLFMVFLVFVGGIIFVAYNYFSALSSEKVQSKSLELIKPKCDEFEKIKSELLRKIDILQKESDNMKNLKSDYAALQNQIQKLQKELQAYKNKDPSYEKIAEYLEKNINDNTTLFITGNAGSGKSYIINLLPLKLKGCVLLAPTGVSASIIHGATIHSFFKLPPKLWDKIDINRAAENVKDKINIIKYLIIDEISMVSAYTMDCIDEILRKAKKSNDPFGGIKLVVSGDLYQLPPVIEDESYEKILKLNKKRNKCEYDYFFKANAFKNMGIKQLFLEEQHRADKDFCSLLDNIRNRVQLNRTLLFFKDRVSEAPTKNTLYLTHKNDDVKKINESELNKLKGREHKFLAYRIKNQKRIECPQNDEALKNTPFSQCIKLKKGAIVMFVINISDEIYNGTMGIVKDFGINEENDSFVKVEKLNTKEILIVTPHKWDLYEYEIEKDENGKDILKSELKDTVYQIPLNIAFAMTVHKAQGKTIDKIYYDCNKPWLSGQTYVGLSRTKKLKDLTLKREIKDTDIYFDDSITDFYKKTEKISI